MTGNAAEVLTLRGAKRLLHEPTAPRALFLALRSFEWTLEAFSAKEVPASEPVYAPKQADGTCTVRCTPTSEARGP